MRIAKIILMTLIFSFMVMNFILAIAFDTWYTYSGWFMALWSYSGWFMALWCCCIAYSMELDNQKIIKDREYKKLYENAIYSAKEIRTKESQRRGEL